MGGEKPEDWVGIQGLACVAELVQVRLFARWQSQGLPDEGGSHLQESKAETERLACVAELMHVRSFARLISVTGRGALAPLHVPTSRTLTSPHTSPHTSLRTSLHTRRTSPSRWCAFV